MTNEIQTKINDVNEKKSDTVMQQVGGGGRKRFPGQSIGDISQIYGQIRDKNVFVDFRAQKNNLKFRNVSKLRNRNIKL